MTNRCEPVPSLLFLSDDEDKREIDETAKADLNLDFIIGHMIEDRKKGDFIEKYASLLCQNRKTVNFRLDILDDLLGHDELVDAIAGLEPHIIRLKYYAGHPGKDNANPLQESVWRLRELEEYLHCVDNLHRALGATGLRSEGLGAFYRFLDETRKQEAFRELREDLPPFIKKINKIKSVTVGINLNEGLIPFEAALLEANPFHYERSRFFPQMSLRKDGKNSLGPLHTTRDSAYYGDPTMVPLFRDLSDILGKSVAPLKESLRLFDRARMLRLIRCVDELSFFLGAVRLIRRVRAMGLPMARPVLGEREEEFREIEGFYNLELALRTAGRGMVPNDFRASPGERSFVVTGPNNGGKTTFLQALGIVQYLAQLGLYVPAVSAELSLCRNILTHYPNLEISSNGFGRFVEEAGRLTGLVGRLESHCLVLLNETFSSTNMDEACYIAGDLLEAIDKSRALTLFVTHMHKLASGEGGSAPAAVKSLVAQVRREGNGDIAPIYRVIPAEPEGKSYAREIARRYKLGKEDLLAAMGPRAFS